MQNNHRSAHPAANLLEDHLGPSVNVTGEMKKLKSFLELLNRHVDVSAFPKLPGKIWNPCESILSFLEVEFSQRDPLKLEYERQILTFDNWYRTCGSGAKR